MKHKKVLFSLALGLGLGSSALFAQTKVQQVDADTLLVELAYGKPPHGRMLIERDQNPEAFAAFDEIRLKPKRNLFAGFFSAPGKSHYPQPARGVDAPEREVAEFAQFEEEERDTRVRHWHGAPGKANSLR
ncbi:MAG: hypothetical protein SV422_02065 [Pseudomonadota bacterium]|nr:hypothetical protein [Pseudomonadota bacterium]